jgi:adenosine kinase
MSVSKVIVTGTLGYDIIMDFPGKFADRIMPDKLHVLSLSFLVDTMKRQFGGTAGNIAYSMKLLGMDPIILSVGGNDFASYTSFLEETGLTTAKIRIEKKLPTSTYTVITDKTDNQIGAFYVGPTAHADKLEIASIKGVTFAVLAPTAPQAMVKYVKDCITLHIPYLYDPAFQIETFTPSQLEEGISHAALLIGNDYEIALIEKKLACSHADLLKKVPIVITTLGAKGSVIEKGSERFQIPVAKVSEVVDPTGAGDAYRAGFLAGYLYGKDLETSGRMGAVAAAYAVENYGTMTHAYTKEQFSQRYKESFV